MSDRTGDRVKSIARMVAIWVGVGAAANGWGQGAPTGKLPAWDVVSVKENRTDRRLSQPDYNDDGDEIRIRNLSLRRILQTAFDFHRPGMIFGLPEWAQSARYDIVGKVTEADMAGFRALSDTERASMLVPILADRFHLKSHMEMREFPVFALVVAKDGPKMKAATAENSPNSVEWTSDYEITGQGGSMKDLTYALSGWRNAGLERPVIDRTGLKGRYDFKLRFTPNHDDPDDDDPDDPGVWIFTAVQRQLGLKLEPTRGKVECLVIESINPPTAN